MQINDLQDPIFYYSILFEKLLLFSNNKNIVFSMFLDEITTILNES